MLLKQLISYGIAISSIQVAIAQNITYNVIASPQSADMSVVVVVDNQMYPLSKESSIPSDILYRGKAPISKIGYHYAIVDSRDQINATESFTRAPIQSNTVNEFFNRSFNTFNVMTLPQIYDPISVIHRIDSKIHDLKQIPTIHIWGNETAVQALHQNQLEDMEVSLNFTYYSLNDVQTFQNVDISLAGRSSRFIPKVSYTLKMKKKGNDSLYGYKNIKLRALGMDPTYLREYIAYSTLKAVGVPASGFSYVRLFINKRPVGLFGLIETFQDPWLANEFANGDSSYKSGNLYQGQIMAPNQSLPVYSDLSYYGDNSTIYSLGQYKIKAGPGKKAENLGLSYRDLQGFTKFINESNQQTSVDEWEKHLDTEGFIRAMTIEDFLGFSDAYMTMADNYYVYSDPQRSDRMIYIPSDLDTSIGIALFDMNLMLSGNYSQHPGFQLRPLTSKFFSNPKLLSSYHEIRKKVIQSLVNPAVMNPVIENMIQMIHTDIEWDQTLVPLGKFSIPPMDDLGGDIPEGFGLFPTGFRTNWTDVPQTFNSSLNGPTNSTTMESVKGFISKKNANVLKFYNITQ